MVTCYAQQSHQFVCFSFLSLLFFGSASLFSADKLKNSLGDSDFQKLYKSDTIQESLAEIVHNLRRYFDSSETLMSDVIRREVIRSSIKNTVNSLDGRWTTDATNPD